MKTIKFKTSYETLISRCPGLFAYIELDNIGNAILHSSIDSPLGCYGKIVENIRVNFDFIINENNETLLHKDNVYTYKTLMSLYFKYNNKPNMVKVGYNSFIDFMNYRIGKKYVDFSYDEDKNDLVPEFIYLSTAKKLYSEMLYLKFCADFYVRHKNNKDILNDNQSEKELQCKCILFIRRGGQEMINFLKKAVQEATVRSNVIYEEAKLIFNTVDNFKINYSVNLFASDKDMGILPSDSLCDNETKTVNVKLAYKTNSKLKSLRRFKNYIDKFGDIKSPLDDVDWLFYYRIGSVANLSTINDAFGNIETDVTMGETTINDIKTNDKVENLVAYGDVIENIELFKDKKAIRFTYWTDVHLIAKCKKVDSDDDGNKKVKYENFEIDPNYDRGIKYTETYYYDEKSEINNLTELDFIKYVNGEFDSGENKKMFEKYEFLTYNNKVKTYKRINDNKVAFDSIISDSVETNVVREISEKTDGLIRKEYYIGTSYSPTENFDVNIDRGVTSVFDSHIRFSEIKNLNELEKFSNGGFYSLR